MNIQQALCAPFQAAVLKVSFFICGYPNADLLYINHVSFNLFIGMNCMINKEEDRPLAETVKNQVVFLV